jgi:hypothetical protein
MKVERPDPEHSLLEARIHNGKRLGPRAHAGEVAWRRLARLAAVGGVCITIGDSPATEDTMLEVTAWDGYSYRVALPPSTRELSKRRGR